MRPDQNLESSWEVKSFNERSLGVLFEYNGFRAVHQHTVFAVPLDRTRQHLAFDIAAQCC
jgi:hypothetical protein